MGAINSAVRSLARAFEPSTSVVLNQAETANTGTDKNQLSGFNDSIGLFPDLGADYKGSQLSIFNGIKTVPAATRCVQVKTDITARLPKYVETIGRFPERVENHWINFLFANPNPVMSRYDFERYIYSTTYGDGDSWIIIERDDNGDVTHLTPAKFGGYKSSGNPNDPYILLNVPDIFTYGGGGISTLTSNRIGTREELLSNVIHLTDGTYNPFSGKAIKPMLQKGRNPVGLYLAVLKRYEASLFLGGHARNYLQTSVEQWKTFSNMIKESGFRGLMSASKTVPLPFGSVITEAGRSHVESQTLEMLMFLIGDIARAWGIPLFMLFSDVQSGSSGKASRPDLAEQFINFVRTGYGTEALSFEDEWNRKLLGVNRNNTVRVKFDLDSLTSGTMQQKAQLASDMVAKGIWTINEGREYTNKPPREGADVLISPIGAPGNNEPIGNNNNNNNNDDDVENAWKEMFQYSRFENIEPKLTVNQL